MRHKDLDGAFSTADEAVLNKTFVLNGTSRTLVRNHASALWLVMTADVYIPETPVSWSVPRGLAGLPMRWFWWGDFENRAPSKIAKAGGRFDPSPANHLAKNQSDRTIRALPGFDYGVGETRFI